MTAERTGKQESLDPVRITFGMIVFNGIPFLEYNLRAVYPLAHQIIVVEGACRASASVAGVDGHSTDGTLELLYRLRQESDPDGKLIIVTADDEGYADGFWPEKDEMSEAYARRATGNYLWQLDSDEFYHEKEAARLVALVAAQRPDMISFPMLTFWGSPEYLVDGFYLIRDRHDEIPRVFAWGSGYAYATHRPATVVDERGKDLREKQWLRACELRRLGIFMYHYSLLFPHQVFDKVKYYQNRLKSDIDSWEESVYRRLEKPFRAHNVYQHLSWLERFRGEHPAAILDMMADIRSRTLDITLRDCHDVEGLLSRCSYTLRVRFLKVCAHTLSVQPFYFAYRACMATTRRLAALVPQREKRRANPTVRNLTGDKRRGF